MTGRNVWVMGSAAVALVTAVAATVTYSAAYKLDGGSATFADQSYTSSTTDQSAVWVTNSGVLTLSNATITTSGNVTSTDTASQYGLNAAVLATASGKATLNGATISTTGSGANGLFATGSGSSLTMSNGSIKATGGNAHGVDVTYTGSITLTNVNITTSGSSSSAIATDFGGGTVIVNGGTTTVSGSKSAGIYSTGDIQVSNATVSASADNGAVIDADGKITLNNVVLTGAKHGIMVHNTVGQKSLKGVISITGGTVTAQGGDGFYANGSTMSVTLKGSVAVTASSGNLLNAATSAAGTIVVDGASVSGNLTTDSTSSITATLQNAALLTGKINSAALTLDSTSVWSVTANSTLTTLSDSAAISGTSVSNIKGNGYTVYYDKSLSANSYLGGKTYALVNGGYLAPVGTTISATPAIASGGVVNAASYAAGTAPATWIAIFGTNLASTTAGMSSSDIVNNMMPTTLGGTSVTINGKAAYLYYVSPTQVNVLAPADSSTGQVTVAVTTAGGTATTTATLQTVLPGLFANGNAVLAVRPADSVVINGTGATAKPGDALELYGTGFGATTTTVAAGLIFSGAYATTETPVVTIGGVKATVLYCGLIGPGLYQINVQVPATLGAGTHAVVATIGGVSSVSTAVLAVSAN